MQSDKELRAVLLAPHRCNMRVGRAREREFAGSRAAKERISNVRSFNLARCGLWRSGLIVLASFMPSSADRSNLDRSSEPTPGLADRRRGRHHRTAWRVQIPGCGPGFARSVSAMTCSQVPPVPMAVGPLTVDITTEGAAFDRIPLGLRKRWQSVGYKPSRTPEFRLISPVVFSRRSSLPS